MSKRAYKKYEKNFVSVILSGVGGLFRGIGRIFSSIFHLFNSKLTIMIVPHSQSKVINFQTNIFSLMLGAIIIVGLVSSFLYFNRRSLSANSEILSLQNQNRETLASLDELRDENANLFQAAKRFQASLSQSLSILGISETTSNVPSTLSNSDLSALFNTREIVDGSAREVTDIKELTSYLENAVQPIEQIGKMLETQQNLFTEIPSIWPVKAANAHISQAFGPTVHAIKGYWYIHKGLDFSTWRSGDPIVATASGQVVNVGYDASFGNFVIIKHKHGIYTRYAHMNTTRVTRGETVSQGQVIGTIGNTGLSTGPHLHYEVHIGSDVVDPAKYINVKLYK
ncbi:MAG: peptidoglycan DD-metalloendopeptidase family protein [Treponema sp.]|nr:peptidoglycan DD-metalloendopeptidase family protein [Treponema sp.]